MFDSVPSLSPNAFTAKTVHVYCSPVVISGPTTASDELPFTKVSTGETPPAVHTIRNEVTVSSAVGCQVTRAESPQFSEGKLASTFYIGPVENP